MCSIHLFLCYIFIGTFGTAEIITLLREDDITCVITGGDINKTVFVDPPTLIENADVNPIKILPKTWKHKSKFMGIILDRRWEDFTIFQNTLNITNLQPKNNYGFSYCGEENLTNKILENSKQFFNSEEIYCIRWNHYNLNVSKINNTNLTNVRIYKDDKIIKNYTEEKNYTVLTSSKGLSLWKLHEIPIVRTTTSNTSNMSIPLSCLGKIFISMYVSLKNNSNLKITLESGEKSSENLIQGTSSSLKWIEINLQFEATQKDVTLLLEPIVVDKNKDPQWAVSGIKCYPEKTRLHRAKFSKFPTKNYTCQSLTSQEAKTRLNIVKYPLGCIDEQCSISCAKILGENFTYCENHKICKGTDCMCAWGYQQPDCKTTCSNPFTWDLNCGRTCDKEKCQTCDPKTGCSICKNGFVGEQCHQKLPVLLQAPEIIDINDHTVKIKILNSSYGQGEIKPDKFKVQYKKINETNYTTYLENSYSKLDNTKQIQITNLETKNYDYNIRILLITKNNFSTVNIPLITVYKRSLTVTELSENQIKLKWNSVNSKSAEITYKCQQGWCHFTSNNSEKLSTNTYIIDNLPPHTDCSIKVYITTENNIQQLLDLKNETTRKISQLKDDILPQNISIVENNKTVARFNKCNHFTEPVTYFFEWKCLSDWCSNQTNSTEILKQQFRKTELIDKKVYLLPFTKYKREVTAQLLNEKKSKSLLEITTPHGRPHEIRNLGLANQTAKSICIRFQDPYPPTGHIESYNIQYTESEEIKNVTLEKTSCEEKNQYNFCVINFEQHILNITVRAKNKNIDELGPPISLSLSNDNGKISAALHAAMICFVVVVIITIICLFYIFLAYKFKKYPFDVLREEQPTRRTEKPPPNLSKDNFKELSEHYKRNNIKPVRPKHKLPEEATELEILIDTANQNRNLNIEDDSDSIKVEDFEDYLKKALGDDPYNNKLTKQYQTLQKMPENTCTVGAFIENISKNRYKNLIALDETRVTLKNNGDNDYINANYIEGYENEKAFIAAQAPMKSTLKDFWWMIWQERVVNIIMLTELIENGTRKCEKYWPDLNQQIKFGIICIENISETAYADFIHRRFNVYCGEKKSLTNHFQYTTWPDHGIPLYTQNYTSFLKKVLAMPQKDSPILVHCNAGCGRTGTLILCDIVLRMAAKEKKINFVKTLIKMREQRSNLVNNANQYVFAHFVVQECLFGKDFSMPINDDFQDKVFTVLRKTTIKPLMLHLDKTMELFNQQVKNSISLSDQEKNKNRFSQILPGHTQVYLLNNGNSSNYINAITVDCYRCPKKFIVTQQPLPNTLGDFWQLIKDNEINTIVCLNEIDGKDPNCPQFWSNIDDNLTQFQKIDEKEQRVFTITKLKIVEKKTGSNEKIVNIIIMKNWKREAPVPPKPKYLIMVWKEMFNISWKGNSKIVVTCYDGANASGLFVALSYLLEKIKYEQICDVFAAVRTVRQSREQFVQEWGQLEFLYKAAKVYIEEFDNYDNFSP